MNIVPRALLILILVSFSFTVGASGEEPVRVFILAGQSNMVGAGQVKANPDRHEGQGSLEWLVDSSPEKAKYAHLRDQDGELSLIHI